jgi:rhodanese-related sulfurtransferase
MGNSPSIPKVNFEDIQYATSNPEKYILINTMNISSQNMLIVNTIHSDMEEKMINELISCGKKDIPIIIYGMNANDDTIYKKYQQLISLGFYNVYLYPGGLFEWLLLQDIYSNSEFKTTKHDLDILKYKPPKVFGVQRITY